MKSLNKKEWIAVTVAVVVVGGFFMWNGMLLQNNQFNTMTQEENQSTANDQVAAAGNIVSVHYVGKLSTGEEFDNSLKRGQPIQFILGAGQVIKGWDEGIEGMRVGEKKTLTIPPEKGYGVSGYPPVIPPNATLIFDVELVGVQQTGQQAQ